MTTVEFALSLAVAFLFIVWMFEVRTVYRGIKIIIDNTAAVNKVLKHVQSTNSTITDLIHTMQDYTNSNDKDVRDLIEQLSRLVDVENSLVERQELIHNRLNSFTELLSQIRVTKQGTPAKTAEKTGRSKKKTTKGKQHGS